ncbi:MAG: polysaccharide biosynthesis tyrosine autokinase [Anaeroplasma sp.]
MDEKNDSITLGDLGRVIWKNIILMGIITISITLIGIIYTFGIVKEKYTSTSTIVVAINTNNINDNVDYTNSLRVVTTVAELVKQDIILDKAAKDINDIETSTLRSMVSTNYSTTSLLVQIKVTGTNKTKTKEYANAITNALIEVSNSEDYKFINGAISQTTPAKEGVYSSPNKKLYVLISFVLGAIISCVVVFFKEFLSNKFKTKKDVENILDEKIIGLFYDNKNAKEDNFKLLESNVSNFESFNKLLNNIKYSNIENPYKVIMITSSIPDELKSTTLVNLASCMINNKKRVVIIDLDTRKPVVHKFFNVTKEIGLVDYIEGAIKKEELIKHTENGTDVITLGKSIPNPTVIIESKALASLISELKEEYDYVLIDTPPVLACSDAQVISKLCDGVIYNVAMNFVKKNDAKECITSLRNINSNIIGVNITKHPFNKHDSYYYYKNYEEAK